MVPVVPFSVWFAAIVVEQAPECHTYSRHFLALPECLPPKPPELSMVVILTPTEETGWQWDNHDVFYWRRKCHIAPGSRAPAPYWTGKPSLKPGARGKMWQAAAIAPARPLARSR
jgi:hypothetical protein